MSTPTAHDFVDGIEEAALVVDVRRLRAASRPISPRKFVAHVLGARG